ncbi:MAG TPA: hypothetical protein VKB59_08800 [Micromonosporaceae bacterium]|nr:hypothetical protein [Micromonosporaceae bacterium]
MADTDDDVTEAHDQRLTVHILTHVPEHQPRETDPHYHLFIQAKERMKRQGLWRCAINDDYCGGNIELHHSHIEFSQVGTEDLSKVNIAFGLNLETDDQFQTWIESPGNLEPLCEVHHRTHYGVHVLPGPLWEPLRYRKANMKPSAEFVTADEFANGTAVDTKTTQHATVKQLATVGGPATETRSDVKTLTKVSDGGHHVNSAVRSVHTEEHHTVPRQRAAKPKGKKGFFHRMFGG